VTLIVWLAGVLGMGLPLGVGAVAVMLRVRRGDPIGANLAELLGNLRRQSGIHRPVRLVRTRQCEIPATWGALRPVILLPGEAAEWPELAHIK
jgi:beta-lactamase regulating signal transducer with metallopeptidase domain